MLSHNPLLRSGIRYLNLHSWVQIFLVYESKKEGMKKRFAIKIAYLGQNYHGFQRQKEGIQTVEGTILETLLQQKIIDNIRSARYSAAGRTDQGVNALGQVIAFDAVRDKFCLEELNANLPDDIFAWGISQVPSIFNARRDAILRIYRYFCRYKNENIGLLTEALKRLKGTHDFKKLCKKPDPLPSGYQKSTVLTLETAKVTHHKKNAVLEFEFASRSFLWYQVRKMVSLVLQIGAEDLSMNIIDELLDPEIPLLPGGIKPAPPEGLVLYDVLYEPNVSFQKIQKKTLVALPLERRLDSYTALLSVITAMKKNIL